MYLSVSETTISSVLIKEEGGIQAPVYYTSRAFRGVEERYPRAEKMVFALVVTARRLMPHFYAHTIKMLTDQSLRIILHKLETSERLVTWSVELSEFNIEYHSQGAIKEQAIANFIAKYTHAPGEESET